MNKKDLSERDICTKFITPSVVNAGWDIPRQIREEVGFTKARSLFAGKQVTRGKAQGIQFFSPMFREPLKSRRGRSLNLKREFARSKKMRRKHE